MNSEIVVEQVELSYLLTHLEEYADLNPGVYRYNRFGRGSDTLRECNDNHYVARRLVQVNDGGIKAGLLEPKEVVCLKLLGRRILKTKNCPLDTNVAVTSFFHGMPEGCTIREKIRVEVQSSNK